MDQPFRDRRDAGRALADRLSGYAGRADLVVLALPRGGVPVGYEVARALGASLDVFLVRKLGVPGREELAMGAIASGGVRHLNEEVIRALRIDPKAIADVTATEADELARRERAYRDDRPPVVIRDRVVILVDDGLATGSSMRAAVVAVRRAGPSRIVIAVPVAAASTCEAFRDLVDDVICALTPEPFRAVGLWYLDFSQTTDDEVRDLLDRASRPRPQAPTELDMTTSSMPSEGHPSPGRIVRVAARDVTLEGDLTMPEGAVGVILFAHGSGSSRHSPRNRFVAESLHRARLATLLIDLLTLAEEKADARTARLRFDIGLLADRLAAATDWLAAEPETRNLPVGYFGASTGGGAALVAAAGRPGRVGAVVSRGGRPDLAGDALGAVKAPTLLIVGGLDTPVIAMNREALDRLPCEKELAIVPGGSHLFEEPGTLDEVAQLARGWFVRHLTPHESASRTL